MKVHPLCVKSDKQRESLWNQYIEWQKVYNEQCTACQIVSEERFTEYLDDKEITKIVLVDDLSNDMMGFVFITKQCEKTEFFNPIYFQTHPMGNVGFIPRGCMCVNPNIWHENIDKDLLLYRIKQIAKVDRIVIDCGDVKGPFELLPEGELIDKMTGIGWNLQDCNYKSPTETPGIHFLHNFRDVAEVDLETSWKLFIQGFDNVQDSICPPLFDEQYYAELFADTEIAKSFVEVDGQIVGGMIVLPIEKIPFIERDKLDHKIGRYDNLYFILTMTVLKEFRSIKIFKYLSMNSMDLFIRSSFIVMDHSQNINPGFLSAIKRTLILKNENIKIIGNQIYNLIASS